MWVTEGLSSLYRRGGVQIQGHSTPNVQTSLLDCCFLSSVSGSTVAKAKILALNFGPSENHNRLPSPCFIRNKKGSESKHCWDYVEWVAFSPGRGGMPVCLKGDFFSGFRGAWSELTAWFGAKAFLWNLTSQAFLFRRHFRKRGLLLHAAHRNQTDFELFSPVRL